MSLHSALIASAIGALVGRPVITHNDESTPGFKYMSEHFQGERSLSTSLRPIQLTASRNKSREKRTGTTVHLVPKLRGGGAPWLLNRDFLDSAYDYNFTHINDSGVSFSRGGHSYKRPCGWQHYALKVDNKYGSNTWLGQSNAPGVWPVSYHGTGYHNSLSIADEGFKLAKGVRFAFGRGVYSTPNVATAEQYAKEFANNGERYKVVIQSRVNPANLHKYGDYWVSPRDEDIRPYGLCIKKM